MRAQSALSALLVYAVVLAVGVGYGLRHPTGPLLSAWLILGVVAGLLGALFGRVDLVGRIRRILIGFGLFFACAFLSTWYASTRTGAPIRLRHEGVFIRDRDTIRVGAGLPDLDVVLGAPLEDTEGWALTLARQGTGWGILPNHDADVVRIAPARSGLAGRIDNIAAPVSISPGGRVLSDDGDHVRVLLPDGSADTLTLRDDGSGDLALRSARYGEWILTPDGALKHRERRQIVRGTPLATLRGARTNSAPYERFVRVRRLKPGEIVNDPSPGDLRRLWATTKGKVSRGSDRYLITSSPVFPLEVASADDISLATAPTRVTVQRGGESWAFVVSAYHLEPNTPSGLRIRFRRHPGEVVLPLPEGLSCSPGVACGVLALNQLPPPISHLSLAKAGLDPDRFGLLAQLRSDDDGIWVTTARDSLRLTSNADEPSLLAPHRIEDDTIVTQASHYLMLSASPIAAARSWDVIFTTLGLLLIPVGIWGALGAGDRKQRPQPAPTDTPFALALVAILLLITVRMILGLRLSVYAPYLDRGIATAVGLWLAACVTVAGLLCWTSWGPRALASAHARFAHRPKATFWATAGLLVRLPFEATFKALTLLVRFLSRRPWAGLAFGVGIAFLLATRPGGLWGIVWGSLVLLVWFAVAWVAYFTTESSARSTFEGGAWAVLTDVSLPKTTRQHRNPLSLSANSIGPSGMTGFAIAVAVAIVLSWALKLLGLVLAMALTLGWAWWTREAVPGAEGRRSRISHGWYAIWLTQLALGTLAFVGSNTSVALFALVIILSLISIRTGRWLALAMDTQASHIGLRATLVSGIQLLLPAILLWPLLAIDLGLLLVIGVPIGFATLLASGSKVLKRGQWAVVGCFGLVIIGVLYFKVLFPSYDRVATARTSYAEIDDAFQRTQSLWSFENAPGIGGYLQSAMARVASRAIATHRPELAQQVLLASGPSEATDLLLPALEQTWGARAYVASGPTGVGLGQGVIGGRGVAEPVSYAENAFAVYIAHEHGAIGAVLVIGLYVVLLSAIVAAVLRLPVAEPGRRLPVRTLLVLSMMLLVIPALYVAAANLSIVPLTGQNMPFLGLNAWSDVVFTSGALGMLVTAALKAGEV